MKDTQVWYLPLRKAAGDDGGVRINFSRNESSVTLDFHNLYILECVYKYIISSSQISSVTLQAHTSSLFTKFQ